MLNPIIFDVECIVCNKSLQKLKHNPDTREMGKISNNSNRRLRTPNWSADEKQYLLELINARKEVVIPKNNNGPHYSEEKDIAWHEILKELAVKFGAKFCSISIKKVKTQWQNMKRIAREEISQHGVQINKLTRQTLEVCSILDMIKDGVLKIDDPNLNETMLSTTNIEVKTERIDEDVDQPSCSGKLIIDIDPEKANTNLSQPGSASASIASDQASEQNENDAAEEMPLENVSKKHSCTMTDECSMVEPEPAKINPFYSEMKDYFKFITTEKIMKMESLKEERQVVRAMRETAELNKIIAEQKLKHVLWLKKQEMAMYSGGPGSGAGQGGGGGGSIREAGGAFGKMEAAKEDQYFYNKQKEQLQDMKKHLGNEIQHHEAAIKSHEDAIRRHKEKLTNLDKTTK